MTKFEYKTFVIEPSGTVFNKKIDIEKMEKKINQLGQQGWELISNITRDYGGSMKEVVLIFKRII